MSNLVHRASEPEVVELVEEAIALTPPQFRIMLADSYRLLAIEGDITNIQKFLDAARAGEIEKLTRWTTQLASDIAKMKQALYHLDQKQQRLGQRQDDLEQRVKELENTRETQDYYPPPPPPPPSQPFNSYSESHQHKHFHINSDGFLLALWLAPMTILLLTAAVDSVRNLIRDSNSALPQIEESSFQQVTVRPFDKLRASLSSLSTESNNRV